MTKSSENRELILESLLNTVSACIFSKDLDGRYTYVNQAVLDVFALSEEDVLGKDDSHFFDLEKSRELIENDQFVMQNGQTLETEESNYIKSYDEVRTFHILKKPTYDKHGNVIGLCGIATDITEQIKLRNKLHEQNELLDLVLNNVAAHVYMKDDERRFLYVNDHVAKLFGMKAEDVIGQCEQDILDEATAKHFHESDLKLFASNKKQIVEETIEDELGNQHHYLSVKVPFEKQGRKTLVGFSTEVTELYNLKEQFRIQANTDYLTEVYNRRYFVEIAEREFKKATRSEIPLALMSIDIDNFKLINDNFGHLIGDKVLKKVAFALSENLREEDVLARIGGEEFAIILPNTSFDEALIIANRIRQYQENNLIETEDNVICVKVSIGLVIKEKQDTNFEQLFNRVDKSLYMAKSQGRNRVVATMTKK